MIKAGLLHFKLAKSNNNWSILNDSRLFITIPGFESFSLNDENIVNNNEIVHNTTFIKKYPSWCRTKIGYVYY